jgi:ubiquinone/menaquinone biosynthesis C-methylase UbiE
LQTKGNLFSKFWRKVRRLQITFRKEIGVQNYVWKLHKEWLSKLTDKSILDLGCFSGNDFIMYIAKNTNSYIGLDLSSTSISELNRKLRKSNIKKQLRYFSRLFMFYPLNVGHFVKKIFIFLCEKNQNRLQTRG